MKEYAGFIFKIHGKIQTDDDIVIGDKIEARSISKQQRVLQVIGFTAEILVVETISCIKKYIHVQSIKDLSKLFSFYEADIPDCRRDYGKFDIIFKDEEMLCVNQVILIRTYDIPVITDTPQDNIRFLAGGNFPVQTAGKIKPWIQLPEFPDCGEYFKRI